MRIQFFRVLLGAILAGVVIFVWGFVFWGLIPAPSWSYRSVPESQIEPLGVSIKALERGTYVYPTPEMEDVAEKHKAGPIYLVSVIPDGYDMGDPVIYGEGIAHTVLAALFAGVLLSWANPALCCYSHRVAFVALLGFFASMWSEPIQSIWFMRTCGASTWHVIYAAIAWFLAGLIMAAIVTGPKSDTSDSK